MVISIKIHSGSTHYRRNCRSREPSFTACRSRDASKQVDGNPEGLDAYGEDNNGNPAFVANDASTNVLQAMTPAAALWHVDLVFDTDAGNTQYVFSGTLNGFPMQYSGASEYMIIRPIGAIVQLTLSSDNTTAGEGSAVVQYDNVLVTKFDN